MIYLAQSVGFYFLFVRVAIVAKNIAPPSVEKLAMPPTRKKLARNMQTLLNLERITVTVINYIGSMAVNLQS